MTPEKKVENKIRKSFINNGGYIIKNYASPNTNKGIPDLIGVMNGIYVALEIKKLKNGKPTPVQIKELQKIANAGGLAFVTNDEKLIPKLVIKTNNYKSQKLNSKKIDINHLITKQQLSVSQASHAWHQATNDEHSLQILKHEKGND